MPKTVTELLAEIRALNKKADPKIRERLAAQLKTVRQRQSKKSNLVTKSGYKVSPFCPHQPFEKQELFLQLPHFEAFYGGAVGGGPQIRMFVNGGP